MDMSMDITRSKATLSASCCCVPRHGMIQESRNGQLKRCPHTKYMKLIEQSKSGNLDLRHVPKFSTGLAHNTTKPRHVWMIQATCQVSSRPQGAEVFNLEKNENFEELQSAKSFEDICPLHPFACTSNELDASGIVWQKKCGLFSSLT